MKKRALVTGGNSPIGSAICEELASADIHTIVHGHSHPDSSGLVVEHIRSQGGSAESISFNLMDAIETEQAVLTLLKPGPIQILVHNAGIFEDGPMAGMSHQQWDRVVDVTLNGFFYVTQPLLLPMLRTRWGRIVTISSLRYDRTSWPDQLCRGKGWPPWGQQIIGHRGGLTWSDGQRGRPGIN